jgi:tetraacyldisaccharide 4'-kinase
VPDKLTGHWDRVGLGSLALSPLAGLYSLGWLSYLAAYRLGLKRAKSPHSPVVCIGNLRAGGLGKTPTTLHVADVLSHLRRHVVLSMSAYGSPAAEAAQLCPDGPLSPSVWGDEPALARFLHPSIPIIAGRRRVQAAEICHEEFADSVLLMDDGFQHLPIKKHVTILLDPPDPPNPMCFPAGPFREPRSGRRRADTVIPGEFRAERTTRFWRFPSGVEVPADSLAGARATALCAIGSPHGFVDMLRILEVNVERAEFFRDHDPLTKGNLFSDLPTDVPVVTTLKDWVKLRERSDIEGREFLVAHYEVSIEPHEEFKTWLKNRLDEIVP